jgi:hypothetical protein
VTSALREVQSGTARSEGCRCGGWLALVLAGSLALRLAFAVFWPGSVEWSDARGYHELALHILHDGTFPSAFRSPGYPAFVAAVYAVFGESQLPVLLIQSLIGTLGVWMTYLLGIEILGAERRQLALAAAALFGLSPGVAYFSAWLVREACLTFLVPLAAWVCLRMLGRSWRYAIPLGVTGCVLAYVRMEVGLFLATMLALALLHRRWRWRALGGGALAGAIVVAGTAPWVLHCALTRGYANMQVAADANLFARAWHLSPTGSVEPELRRMVLEKIKNRGVTDQEQRSWIVATLLTEEIAVGDIRGEVRMYERMGAIARENIRRHPFGYLATMPWNLFTVMGGEPFKWWRQRWFASLTVSWRERNWGVLAMLAFNYLLWPVAVTLLVLVALVWVLRHHDVAARLFVLTLLGVVTSMVSMTMVNSQGQPHLRLPYDCVLYIATALGFAVLLRRVKPLSAEP